MFTFYCVTAFDKNSQPICRVVFELSVTTYVSDFLWICNDKGAGLMS